VGIRALVAALWVAGCGASPPTAARQPLTAVEPGVWTQRAPLFVPPPREMATLTWDAKRQQAVLFGGYDNSVSRNDTWTVSTGAAWLGACTTASCVPPSPRYDHAAAFDAARGVLVLYGGTPGPLTVLADTWEWNGTTWTQRCSACAPGPRLGAAMAWDPVLGHVILFGGGTYATAGSDIWQWDGTLWTPLAPATRPSARWLAALTTDTVRGRVLLFGGTPCYSTPGCAEMNDLWEWDGATWTPLCTTAACVATTPPQRSQAGFAFDPFRRRTVLFGGTISDSSTHEWDGSAWNVTASVGPIARSAPSMAWFPADQRVLLFGGAYGFFQSFGDTWEYHARGGPCGSAADCDGPACVDGVCCESAACGTCQRCDGLGASGVCTPVLNAVDPDTCAGSMICDASGSCKLQDGQACRAASDCASGFCAGGLCCNRACSLACETCAPVGAAGTCATAPAGTQAAACGAYRCNGANADCPIACAADGDCVPGFYCSAGACSTALPLGLACTSDHSCQSGHCVDGVCCDSACSGRCQFCGSGTCAIPVGADPRGDCAGDPGCAGACQGDGTCQYPGAETACDVCKVCNQSGRCNQPPRSGDDARCGQVTCAALSTECRTFADVARRCVDVGLCAQPNDPTLCTALTEAPDGTACGDGGACQQGACSPTLPATPKGKSSGGCALGGASPNGSGAPLVLSLLAVWMRRRWSALARPACIDGYVRSSRLAVEPPRAARLDQFE
jgi:hypothetical protein